MTHITDQSLDCYRRDHVWLFEHRKELLSPYRNKWVAVRDQKVIDSDEDLDILCARLENPGDLVIEYITDDPLEMIL